MNVAPFLCVSAPGLVRAGSGEEGASTGIQHLPSSWGEQSDHPGAGALRRLL